MNKTKKLILIVAGIIVVLLAIISVFVAKIIFDDKKQTSDKAECIINGGYIDANGKCILDNDSHDKQYTMGDKVVLNKGSNQTSTWYVIEDSGNTVKLIAATSIGKHEYDESENCQNYIAHCAHPGEQSFECTDRIYHCNYIYGASTLKENVDKYGKNLNLGNDLISVGLLNGDELKSLGCKESTSDEREKYECGNAPKWLTSDSHWTSIWEESDPENFKGYVYYIWSHNKNVRQDNPTGGISYGVRPVITVNKSIVAKS